MATASLRLSTTKQPKQVQNTEPGEVTLTLSNEELLVLRALLNRSGSTGGGLWEFYTEQGYKRYDNVVSHSVLCDGSVYWQTPNTAYAPILNKLFS